MSLLNVLSRSLRAFVPATLLFLGLAAPRALALVNDELLPANLIGKTLTFTHNAQTPNTLEPAINTYRIVFSTASTYVRSSAGLTTEGGTYSVIDSSINASTGARVTLILINNNWFSPGNNTQVSLTLAQAAGFGAFAAGELFNPIKNSGGTFTIGGSGGGGGTAIVPVITSATNVTATVGGAFTYQITANNVATSFGNSGGNAPISINPTTGLVTGTFTAAGTFTFSFTATNAAGTSAITVVTVTASGGTTGAPAFVGSTQLTAAVGVPFTYQITTSPAAVSYSLLANTGAFALVPFTGRVDGPGAGRTFSTAGTYTFTVTATNAAGTSAPITFTVVVTNGGGTPTIATAPANLVGYRNKVGGVYQFTLTGVDRGAVWGTDVYTDDSAVAAAAVHAGVLRNGETKTVTITILAGQSSYAASLRNGVSSAAWPTWPGSYSFAGAGAVTGVSVATARPAAAPGFTAGTAALAAGGRLVCPVNVTGGGTYSYQWFLNGLLIAGATANPYIVESLTTANAGTYAADVTNSLGTVRITAGSITIGAAGSPVIALQPLSKIVVPGATVSFATSATGSGLAYQWFRNNVALAGETGAILLRNNVNAADAGTYTVRISNSAGTVTSTGGTLTLSATASRPANISVRTNVATGTTVIPGFVLQGTGTKRVLIRAVGPGLAQFNLTGLMADPKFAVYQGANKIAENDDWTTANIGQGFVATGAFAIAAGSKDAALVTDLAAGKDYTVQVTNSTGTGGLVIIEVYDADALVGTSTSKLVNVSVRGQTAPGADVLTLGLVITGQGQRTLLVRGIGPKLAAFGVTGTVPDPRLQIFDSQARAILANDDWSSADFVNELAIATTYVGAFALDAGSKDAATLSLVDPGAYTIQVSGTAAAPTGEALVEVYEVP